MSIYLALAAISVLAGFGLLTRLRLPVSPIHLWYLAPGATLAQAQGEIEASGDLPRTTFTSPPGRFPVKLVVEEHDNALFLAAGARGAAAIYTEHLTLIHLIRKVLIRTASYLDYIIIKHSISLH